MQTAPELFKSITSRVPKHIKSTTANVTGYEGVTFQRVGRNASHDFYLALVDDKIVVASLGEYFSTELDDFVDTWHTRVVGDDLELGYLGHY